MSPLHIVAEAGTNHNGNFDTALQLIRKAKEAGASSVKFQIINPEILYVAKILENGVPRDNPVVEQRRQTMLTNDQYRKLAAHCKKLEIHFSASVFDTHGIDLLCELDVPYIKIASCDLSNLALLRYAAKSGKKLVLSTGFSTLAEIRRSVDELEHSGCHDLVIMHCVAVYPSSLKISNLQFIDQLRETFPHPIGFSDHTPNSLPAVIALSKGCTWFEKHLTLDKTQSGFDHSYALEPDEFSQFVTDLHDAEEACAFHEAKLTNLEKEVGQRARRSLYAARDIRAGEILEAEDILVVRPSGAFSAADIDQVVGARLARDISKYENITREHLS